MNYGHIHDCTNDGHFVYRIVHEALGQEANLIALI